MIRQFEKENQQRHNKEKDNQERDLQYLTWQRMIMMINLKPDMNLRVKEEIRIGEKNENKINYIIINDSRHF